MRNDDVSKTTFNRDEYIRLKIYDNVCSIKTQLYVLMKENERAFNPYIIGDYSVKFDIFNTIAKEIDEFYVETN